MLVPLFQAQAGLLDLKPPDPPYGPTFGTSIGGFEIGILIEPVSNFQLSAAGIRFDPRTGGAQSIQLNVYNMTSGGSLIGTKTTNITDNGMAFYDITLDTPLNLVAGTRYDLSFDSVIPAGWGTGLNEMVFYKFDNNPPGSGPGSPYVVGGLITVIDGTRNQLTATDNMPHVRLNSSTTPPNPEIPEPGTFALVGLGLAAVALSRRNRRNRSV